MFVLGISRLSYSGWVVLGLFHFDNCVIYLFMETKVEVTKHPFHLQGVGRWVFFFFLY